MKLFYKRLSLLFCCVQGLQPSSSDATKQRVLERQKKAEAKHLQRSGVFADLRVPVSARSSESNNSTKTVVAKARPSPLLPSHDLSEAEKAEIDDFIARTVAREEGLQQPYVQDLEGAVAQSAVLSDKDEKIRKMVEQLGPQGVNDPELLEKFIREVLEQNKASGQENEQLSRSVIVETEDLPVVQFLGGQYDVLLDRGLQIAIQEFCEGLHKKSIEELKREKFDLLERRIQLIQEQKKVLQQGRPYREHVEDVGRLQERITLNDRYVACVEEAILARGVLDQPKLSPQPQAQPSKSWKDTFYSGMQAVGQYVQSLVKPKESGFRALRDED